MARCALLPAGPGFEQPPIQLRELDPLLYDYLTALHQVIFGTLGNPQGSLGVDNFSGDLGAAPEPEPEDEVPSAPFAHEHPQYITFTQHSNLRDNPHGVTAEQVGSDRALWNASALQNYGIKPISSAPAQNDTLIFDAESSQWVPGKASDVTQAIFIKSEIVDLPTAGDATYVLTNALPQNALILGVTVDVLSAATNAGGGANLVTSVGIGTEFYQSAWGTLTIGVAQATTTVGDFQVANPLYSTNVRDLHISLIQTDPENPVSWPSGNPAKVRIRVHYWATEELETSFVWELTQAHVDEWQRSWSQFLNHPTNGWALDSNGDSTYAILVNLNYIDPAEFSYDNYRRNYHPFFLLAGPQWMVDNNLIVLRSLLPGEEVQLFPDP